MFNLVIPCRHFSPPVSSRTALCESWKAAVTGVRKVWFVRLYSPTPHLSPQTPQRPITACEHHWQEAVSFQKRERIMRFSFLCGIRRSILPEPGHRGEVRVKTKLPLFLCISTAVRRSGTQRSHGFATRGLFPAASNKYSSCDSTSFCFYDKAPVLV